MCFSTVFLKKKKAFLLKYKQQNKFLKKTQDIWNKTLFQNKWKKDRLKFSLFRWGHSDYYFLVTDNQTSVSSNCEIPAVSSSSLKDTPEL